MRKLTVEDVGRDLSALPPNYKTGDADALIRRYIQEKADVSALRPHVLTRQQFHRIYYYVPLKQMKRPQDRMAFIHCLLPRRSSRSHRAACPPEHRRRTPASSRCSPGPSEVAPAAVEILSADYAQIQSQYRSVLSAAERYGG